MHEMDRSVGRSKVIGHYRYTVAVGLVYDACFFFQNLKDGQSALFHVVVKGQRRVDLVEKMLEQEANPNIQDAVSMIKRHAP